MKVTGPGSGKPADASGKTEGVEAEPRADKATEPFAKKLDGTGATGKAEGPSFAGGLSPIADVVADLKAGRITPSVAVEKVLGRVLERQLGADVPPAVRAHVETALRSALSDDPSLMEKVKRLGA